MSRSLIVALIVLIVLGGLWFLVDTDPYTADSVDLPKVYQSFVDTDFDKAAKLTIAKGKGKVTLAKTDGRWVVESSWGTPADQEKVEKIVTSLKELGAGEEIGTSASTHERFEVGEKKGATVTAYDDKGEELGAVVVGKSAPGGGIGVTKVFVRFVGTDPTYKVETNLRSDASLWSDDVEGKNYIERDILKLTEYGPNKDEMEVQTVRISRPDQEDLLVERRFREKPVEKPEGEDKEKAEGEDKPEETTQEPYYVVTQGAETTEVGSAEEWQARGILNRANTISVEDAVEPKDLAAYGLDQPQLAVTLDFRKKDDPSAPLSTLKLLFGNAKKDDEGKDDGYYFLIDADGYRDRMYTVAKYKLEGWDKKMEDFLPKKKEEEEKEGDTTEGDGGTSSDTGATDTAGEAAAAGGETSPAEGASPPAEAETPADDGSSPPGPAAESPPAAEGAPPAETGAAPEGGAAAPEAAQETPPASGDAEATKPAGDGGA